MDAFFIIWLIAFAAYTAIGIAVVRKIRKTAREQTQLSRLYDQLRERVRQDIRQPLLNIKSYAEVLERRMGNPGDAQSVRIIAREANTLIGILDAQIASETAIERKQ